MRTRRQRSSTAPAAPAASRFAATIDHHACVVVVFLAVVVGGIMRLTLLLAVPIALGVAHQFTGVLALSAGVFALHRVLGASGSTSR